MEKIILVLSFIRCVVLYSQDFVELDTVNFNDSTLQVEIINNYNPKNGVVSSKSVLTINHKDSTIYNDTSCNQICNFYLEEKFIIVKEGLYRVVYFNIFLSENLEAYYILISNDGIVCKVKQIWRLDEDLEKYKVLDTIEGNGLDLLQSYNWLKEDYQCFKNLECFYPEIYYLPE